MNWMGDMHLGRIHWIKVWIIGKSGSVRFIELARR
jgi:hypothetical protein